MSSEGDIDDDRLHYVVPANALDDGERAVTQIEGRDIAVINAGGELFAVGDHCPHVGGPCAEGMLTGLFAAAADGNLSYSRDNEIICCPWHGWEFDVRTGDHLGGTRKRLLTYDVAVRDGDIFVVL